MKEDITARKQTESALAGERALLRALLDSVDDAIYFKDRASRIIRGSRSLARMFGRKDPAEFDRTLRDRIQSPVTL